MAVTNINLTDEVSALVTKTNTISGDVGNITNVVTGDSNLVDAINTVRNTFNFIDDSSEVIAIARSGLSTVSDSADGFTLAFDSDSGVITLSGIVPSTTVRSYISGDSTVAYDSASGVFSVAANNVSSVQLKNPVQLNVYDASGSLVISLYGSGS